MAASGTGINGIVRYLNEKRPTPFQYARAQGLDGSFDDGNGIWNSRFVKYILTNRIYTGMLVQMKENREVEATQDPPAVHTLDASLSQDIRRSSFNRERKMPDSLPAILSPPPLFQKYPP